jgi:YesN/AraC family two-component response regulator
VLIADDNERARNGLRALLTMRQEIEIVGEAADGQEAVQMVREYQPDVVLM